MTEKRFTIDRFDLLEYGEPVTVEEACDLLNQLNNENEQLKKEIQKWKCINKQLEERLGRSLALDMEECE